MTAPAIPIVLSIAGSDPSGGAGIQADLKTFSALGGYGAAVITALTAQNTRGVTDVLAIPGDFVAKQIDAVLEDLDVRAVKIGMLGGPDVVDAVADQLCKHPVPYVVVDPVMVATSGDRLVSEETVTAIRDRLLPLATVVTPNLPEAAALLGQSELAESDMARAGSGLLALGPGAVLVKGGHLSGPESPDVLVDKEGVLRLTARRVPTRNTHGTGCTLSSAIAVGLAHQHSLREAVREGKQYLTAALEAAADLHVGAGRGPVHHFHDLWSTDA